MLKADVGRVKRRGGGAPILGPGELDALFRVAGRLQERTGDARVTLCVYPGNPDNEESLPYACVVFHADDNEVHTVRFYGEGA